MRSLSVALAFVGLLALAPGAEAQFTVGQPQNPAEDYAVAFDLIYWKPTPDIVLTDDAFITTDPIDFVQIFGIENDRFRELRFTIKPARKHKLRLSYLPIRYSQTALLNTTVRLGGETFVVNTEASTDIDWTLWRAGYEYDLVVGQGGFVGIIGEIKYNDMRAGISATGIGSADTEVQVPIPTVGGIARGYLADAVSVTAEFTGLSLDRDDWRGQFFDLDLYGTLDFGGVGAQVGYRSISTEYTVDADEGDLSLSGWYFGVALRF